MSPRPAILSYGVAVVSVLAAALSRLALNDLLQDRVPFATFFVAVFVTVWYGGIGPSLLCLALGTFAAAFFVRPVGGPGIEGVEGWVSLLLFLFVGGVAIWLSESLRLARLRAEAVAAEAAAQRERLRTTLASIGDAVVVTDDRRRVTLLNGVAEALTGWPAAEAAGRPLEEVCVLVNEQTGGSAENSVARVLREGVVVGLGNHTVLVDRSGTRRPIDDSAAPVRDEQGNVLGAVLVFRDVSERRQMERELRRRADELSERDRRKDEFLAMLAHELRNPLAPIQNALHILDMGEEDRQAFDFAREVIGRQVQHLVRLVDDLLDISRILRGRVELRREQIELSTVVARAVETARPAIDAQRHQLTVALPAEPVRLDADPVRLAQVLANLLHNSAKYTPEGGHIWLSGSLTGTAAGEVVVRVRDTGIGIPAEMLPHIFDLFTQVDAAPGRSQGGLGIGLTLVRRLVELHGGRVDAFSKGPGQGSEFVVRLPALPAAATNAPAVPVAPPPVLRPTRRVLIVDDNVDAANSLALMLRLQGHEVCVVHEGPAAVEAATDFGPDVGVLDIGMPGMDGYELARRLRRLPGLEGVLLIALTGWGQEEFRRRSKEAGFDHHLVKPADPRSLRELLARHTPLSK